MKKKLFAAAAAAALGAVMCVGAAAQGGASITAADAEGVSITADSGTDGRLIFANFDYYGRLIGASAHDAALAAGENRLTYSQLGADVPDYGTRLMLWKDNEPLSDAAAVSRGDAVTLDARLFVSTYYYTDLTTILSFRNSAKSSETTDFRAANDAELIVNGYECGYNLSQFIQRYFAYSNSAFMTLSEPSEEGFRRIEISEYASAAVDEVIETEDGLRIVFDMYSSECGDSITNATDERCSVTIGGKAASVKDIRSGDIVSIAFDMSNSFRAAEHYDIIVSRRSVKNVRMTDIYEDPENGMRNVYTSDTGTGYLVSFDGAVHEPDAGTAYTLRLDAFGNIAALKEYAFSDKLGILEDLYADDDGCHAVISAADGIHYYPVSEDDFNYLTTFLEVPYRTDREERLSDRRPPADRVLFYSEDENGALTYSTDFGSREFSWRLYNAQSGKLGTVYIGDELTEIIDVSCAETDKINVYPAMPIGRLTEDTDYGGKFCGWAPNAGVYRYVVINSGTGYNVNDPMAVVDSLNGYNGVTMFSGGSWVARESEIEPDFKKGDVLFCLTDYSNRIIDTKTVSDMISANADYDSFYEAALAGGLHLTDYNTDDELKFDFKGNAAASLLSGALLDFYRGSVKIAQRQLGSNTVYSVDDMEEYRVAEDVNVYIYDYSLNALTAGEIDDIKPSYILDGAYEGGRRANVVDLAKQHELERSADDPNAGSVNFVIAKMIDYEIKDLLIITSGSGSAGEGEQEDDGLTYALLDKAETLDAEQLVSVIGAGGRRTYPAADEDREQLSAIAAETDPQRRIIGYTLTPDGRLDLAAQAEAAELSGRFAADTLSIDGKRMDSNTVVLDAADTGSITAVSSEELADGSVYTGFAYGMNGADRVYKLVLLTDGMGYNIEHNWAVFSQETTAETDSGERVSALSAWIGGQLLTYPVTADISGMRAGDIFFFRLDNKNTIYDIRMVSVEGMLDRSYRDMLTSVIENNDGVLNEITAEQFSAPASDGHFYRPPYAESELIAGPVMEVSDDCIRILPEQSLSGVFFPADRVNVDGVQEWYFAQDVNVVIYDYSARHEKDRLSVSGISGIGRASFERDAYVGDKKDNIVNLKAQLEIEGGYIANDNMSSIKFAIAKEINGVITELFVVIGDSGE